MLGEFAERVVVALFGAPFRARVRKPKGALAEIIKHPMSKSREIEYLVHSGAVYPRTQRRVFKERET